MIVGCLSDRIGRARIEDGARGLDRVSWFDSFAQALAAVNATPTQVSGVVVGWVDCTGTPPLHIISELRRVFPAVPILGYCTSRAEHLDDLRRMAVAGVHQLLLDSTADSRTVVRSTIEATRRHCAAAQIFAQIEEVVPERLRPVVRVALENPTKATSVATLAREVGVDRKTIHNWCRVDGFLTPRDLLRWARLLLAAGLLNWSNRSVTSVALELEYPTDNSLRIAIKRQFGVSPSAMKRGGLDRAVNAFRAQVARHKEGRPDIAAA